jgi:uncharacterized protein
MHVSHNRYMKLPFVNRTAELKELDAAAKQGGLLVLYGRRRVGKTRLLAHWLARRGGLYSQAIESTATMQIEQVYRDLAPRLATSITPKSWQELLELLRLQGKKRWILCLDEFPYLANADASLPSMLQRWIDHEQPAGSLLILCGSSTRMMNDLFLNRSAALYGRAHKLLRIEPMSYAAFCRARKLQAGDAQSFSRFAMVGGVPHYWEHVQPQQSLLELADSLYFGFAPHLEDEPARILRDEGFSGLNALSVLEAIGRGAAKPSEIAARLGTAQTNLPRLFQQLLDVSLLERELPFGESVRSTKRVLYRIKDPALRFWFQVYSPHRSRWRNYSAQQKLKLLHDHASSVFEDYCRQLFPGAARYWEGDVEFDLVHSDPSDEAGLIVSEVKWKQLSPTERRKIRVNLEQRWQRSALRHRYAEVKFAVLDVSMLRQARK